ncbi:MAG: hypothetical protein ABL917_02820 [Parcubacteria group bacterium]
MNLKQYSVLLSRVSLFIIYFWFGILKVIGLSPASGIVQELFSKTLAHMPIVSSMPSANFLVLFGVFEVIIGILFIIPEKERWASYAFIAHIITTGLPLFFLGSSVWSGIFVPTLEGQYIIKNLALISCVLNIWTNTSMTQKQIISTNPVI